MCTQGDAYKIQDLLAEPPDKATLNLEFKIKCFMPYVSNTNWSEINLLASSRVLKILIANGQRNANGGRYETKLSLKM